MKDKLQQLSAKLEGELLFDDTIKKLYATDASAYREIPTAVAIPKTVDDLKLLIQFANEQKTSLIPRTAGTSLAGQVVGGGIVVDVSKNFNQVLEVNEHESWVRVQPGVVRDDLKPSNGPDRTVPVLEGVIAELKGVWKLLRNSAVGCPERMLWLGLSWIWMF